MMSVLDRPPSIPGHVGPFLARREAWRPAASGPLIVRSDKQFACQSNAKKEHRR